MTWLKECVWYIVLVILFKCWSVYAEYSVVCNVDAVVHKASGMLSITLFLRYESAAISNVTVCRPGLCSLLYVASTAISSRLHTQSLL